MSDKVSFVGFDDESKVIHFSNNKPLPCVHKRVEVNQTLNEILCLDCNKSLNPIVWMADYISKINHATEYNNRVLAFCNAIEENVKSISSVTCAKCGFANPFDYISGVTDDSIKSHLKVVNDEMIKDDKYCFISVNGDQVKPKD